MWMVVTHDPAVSVWSVDAARWEADRVLAEHESGSRAQGSSDLSGQMGTRPACGEPLGVVPCFRWWATLVCRSGLPVLGSYSLSCLCLCCAADPHPAVLRLPRC